MTNFPLRLLLFLYSILLEIAGILGESLLHFSPLAEAWNIRERRCVCPFRHGPVKSETVWLHAASMGESKLLVRFLSVLRTKHPGTTYLLTATTRTGVAYLRRVSGEDIAGIGFLPLDTFRLMRAMTSAFRVSRVWLLETELWPCMLWTCRRQGIPVGLVNARIEQDSLRRYQRFAWLVGPLFLHPDVILAQNRTYADRFSDLGIPPVRIRITGNLKSLVLVRPLSVEQRARHREVMGLSPPDRCITAGCIHPGEGRLIAEAIALLARWSYPVKCIVVPRHLKDASGLARELGNGVIRLADAATGAGWSICQVERMGVLESLYEIADAAIIGGTFDETGGHNMWDAAQFGIPVIFGPAYYTQQESGDALYAAGVGFPVADAQGIARAILSTLRDNVRTFIDARDAFAKVTNAQTSSIESLVP